MVRLGNLYKIYGPLGKCMGFQGKAFFSKFQHFLLFWEWFKCYFWIPHPKLNKGTNFHKNSVIQNQNMNENALPQISKMAAKRAKEKDCGPKLLITISQKLLEIKAWNLVLLLIFTVCTYALNFIEIWKGGFQACPNLMWNSPRAKCKNSICNLENQF